MEGKRNIHEKEGTQHPRKGGNATRTKGGKGSIREKEQSKIEANAEDGTHHTSHTPNIRTRPPLGAEDHLRTAILPRLDIVRKVVFDPSRC
jgi:hypothetical protein